MKRSGRIASEGWCCEMERGNLPIVRAIDNHTQMSQIATPPHTWLALRSQFGVNLQLTMQYFVSQDSIVRRIWGRTDTVLLIFAGAAAEFALNKAVDWLYFTGRLPADPLGRLFSTMMYARRIVFSNQEQAMQAITSIASIHRGVEDKRGSRIPDWAYRDVLFMLIDYSRASFELLERKMSDVEKEELFDVFRRVGEGMEIPGLPKSYPEWCIAREQHLQQDLINSKFTTDLFKQYRKHLGPTRYAVLIEAQKLVIPKQVYTLLQLKSTRWLTPLFALYKFSRKLGLDGLLQRIALPAEVRRQAGRIEA
jgi:hypothetical protein